MNRLKCKKYVLRSKKLKITLTNAGAAVIGIELEDVYGNMKDIVLGYDATDQYLDNEAYFGAIIGRYAGEIDPPSFFWNNKKYELEKDHDGRHLHGGKTGISFKTWNVQTSDKEIGFFCTSKDKEGGYPENVRFYAVYSVENEDTLVLRYGAYSEKDTPVNMTAHPYFNLNGHASNSISDHFLYIDADQYTLTSRAGLASGKKYPCAGNEYDFRQLTEFRKKHYDCNFMLKKQNEYDAILYSGESGIYMKVHCTQPCMQLYTSCETYEIGKHNTQYLPYGAVCLEPQHMPNAININTNITPAVGKHKPYHHIIQYTFGAQKVMPTGKISDDQRGKREKQNL